MFVFIQILDVDSIRMYLNIDVGVYFNTHIFTANNELCFYLKPAP